MSRSQGSKAGPRGAKQVPEEQSLPPQKKYTKAPSAAGGGVDGKTKKKDWCYFLHRMRDSLSPVGRRRDFFLKENYCEKGPFI